MAEVQTPLEDAFQYSSNLENFARIVERGELGGPGAPSGRLSVSMRLPGLPAAFVSLCRSEKG